MKTKYTLVAPGPTPTPERVRLKMAEAMIHHRSSEFKGIFEQAQEGLKWLIQTSTLPLMVTASGTGSFEAVLQTFTRPGDAMLAVGGGKFAERWGEMGKVLGLEVTPVDVEWGKQVTPDQLRAALQSMPEPPALVSLVVSETSTGVLHNLQTFVTEVRAAAPETLIAIDAVTALGVHDINFDKAGIDILVSGSQKALGLPPGLGFVAVSDRSWEVADRVAADSSFRRSYYLDLRKERKKQLQSTTCYTPALTIVIGLVEVMSILQEEGLTAIFERHAALSQFCRDGVSQLGLTLFSEVPSHAVTAIRLPDSVSAAEVKKELRQVYNIEVAGGQDHLKPFLIRIGHLGFIDHADLLYTLDSLAQVMQKRA